MSCCVLPCCTSSCRLLLFPPYPGTTACSSAITSSPFRAIQLPKFNMEGWMSEQVCPEGSGLGYACLAIGIGEDFRVGSETWAFCLFIQNLSA
jgi:hypothetical protein